jgi:hypothetical protein
MRRVAAALTLCLAAAAAGTAQNVVIVVVDGARYSETFGAKDLHIPRLWNDLRPAGMIWTNYRNNGVTTTTPSHATILSGVWQEIANDGSERSTAPSVFEYFRLQTGAPDTAAFVVAGKEKLSSLAHSGHPSYGAPYGATAVIAGSDSAVAWVVDSIVTRVHPRLLQVNFADVDRFGHDSDWTGYLGAITRVDSLIGRLWERLQAIPEYAGSTTLLVTNDHGRHETDFSGHGDGCEGCRHLMLLALGRCIPPRTVAGQMRQHIDIAATVGDLMGFATPFATGTSLLADTVAAEAPAQPSESRGEVGLLENFPNPFNPATTIAYRVPQQGRVRIQLSDLLGRHVATLLDVEQIPGRHSLVLNGDGLATGAYLLSLRAGSAVQTRRLLLLR